MTNESAPAWRHRGDVMSPEQRSALMARIRGRDTGLERTVAAMFRAHGLRPTRHDSALPGRPDFVFRKMGVVVFVDGDFWHGWRFPAWRHKLTPAWEEKIARNRQRDARNARKLRRKGWKVVRLWEHQVERDPTRCIERIMTALAAASHGSARTGISRSSRARV